MTEWLSAAVCAASVTGAGCVTIHPPETQGGSGVQAVAEGVAEGADTVVMREAEGPGPFGGRGAWPARWRVSSGLKRSTISAHGSPPMGIVQRVEGPMGAARRGAEAEKRIEEELAADVALLAQRHRSSGGSETITIRGEGRGSYLFAQSKGPEAERAWEGRAGKPVFYLKFISAREAPPEVKRGQDVRGRLLLIDRTWLAFYEPTGGATGGLKGVALVMPGMFGTPREVIDPFIGALRDRGWCVLRMLAHSSRFTEEQVYDVTVERMSEVAGQVSEELVTRAAECAYAAEGAMMYLDQERPDLATLPRVAVGMSGGAMVLPQVVAREPSRYAGAVLIAGGVDYLKILLESNYTDWIDAVKFRFPAGEAGAACRESLLREYRDRAMLDSSRCCEALAGKKVLILQAEGDKAVPAAQGERMWKLLGEPERWMFTGGHEMLFLVLPWHVQRIINWMDANIPAGAAVGR